MYLIILTTAFKSLQVMVLLLKSGEQKVRVTDSSGYPCGVAVDSSGRVYVTDDHNYRIQVFLWKPNLVANPIEPPIAGFK